MAEKKDRERIHALRKLITYHQQLYHTFDDPQISDDAYDALRKELEALEKKYGKESDSPTQKVGGKVLEGFRKVSHQHPMLSFNDAFSFEEVKEWCKRVETYLHTSVQKKEKPFYAELKIDGLAVELEYTDGNLVRAITRGDGYIGEDVTENIKLIQDIPKHLEQLGAWPVPSQVIIRGEIYVTLEELKRINAQREREGSPVYANTRNFAAGSIRQLDTGIVAQRDLRSFQYDIVLGLPDTIHTHEEEHKVLASWGCAINEHNRALSSLEEVDEFRNKWEKKRDSLPYEVDGIVVIVNDTALFEKAGIVGKAPRAAIAYKFSPKQAVTKIKDVTYQIGRTGVITPVAVLDPVSLGGVRVSHATLHNFDEIERLGVKKGDSVVITRSGDVIPKILEVIEDLRDGSETSITIPKVCPIDGSPLKKDGVYIRCSNPSCSAQQVQKMIHAVSREAFNIQGLGKKVIERFYTEGLITTIADIFRLKEGDIAQLEGFGELSARNIIKEIEKKKVVRSDRFLYALGIPHVGIQTAQTLARMCEGADTPQDMYLCIQSHTKEALSELEDIGDIVSEEIYTWFLDKKHMKMIDDLQEEGVYLTPLPQEKGVFKGMVFCVTGTLSSFSRQGVKERIQSEGGRVVSDVTDSVDVLIHGDSPGSKYTKAQEKGIELWDEEVFLKKLSSGKGV